MRIGLGADRLAALAGHFDATGGRRPLLGKFTHSVGFAALAAAGAGRMKLGRLCWFNPIGTRPKNLFFVALAMLRDMFRTVSPVAALRLILAKRVRRV